MIKYFFIFLFSLSCLSCMGGRPLQPQQGDREDGKVALGRTEWLEMPGTYMTGNAGMHCHTHFSEMGGRRQRNYSVLYDETKYISYWVAYPLCKGHLGEGRQESWQFDPKVSEHNQTSVKKGYGVSVATDNYPRNFYARGHQIPNADRNGVPGMMEQTYYSTNLTPQIQHGFNGHIWAHLESAVRSAVKSDTLYVVTGASLMKKGENLKVKSIKNRNDNKVLPLPNYYWKVMLKVRRDSKGNISEAVTVGFWLPHKDLKNQTYSDFAVSVNEIEEWTGFDFFVNLPDGIESCAESVADWDGFVRFDVL